MGGPLAEHLVRVGCENIVICDNDKYEVSNLNRQLCTREDLGKYKLDVLENFLLKINTEINLKKFYKVSENNISEILEGVKVLTLLLDDPIASIIISRECLKKRIPVLESWTVPYLCAWWFTENSVDYETCYGLETRNLSIKEIESTDSLFLDLKKKIFLKLLKFPNIQDRYNREQGTVEAMISGNLSGRSFAPMVRIMASYISFEVIFAGLLKLKKMILAPNVIGYDYFRMKSFEFSFLK